MGQDPIKIQNPIKVTNESAREWKDSNDYGQLFLLMHYLLYIFVGLYLTLKIMVAKVTKTEFNPYSKLFIAVVTVFIVLCLVSAFKIGDVNFKMSLTLITSIVGGLLCKYIVTVTVEITSILGIEVFTTK